MLPSRTFPGFLLETQEHPQLHRPLGQGSSPLFPFAFAAGSDDHHAFFVSKLISPSASSLKSVRDCAQGAHANFVETTGLQCSMKFPRGTMSLEHAGGSSRQGP